MHSSSIIRILRYFRRGFEVTPTQVPSTTSYFFPFIARYTDHERQKVNIHTATLRSSVVLSFENKNTAAPVKRQTKPKISVRKSLRRNGAGVLFIAFTTYILSKMICLRKYKLAIEPSTALHSGRFRHSSAMFSLMYNINVTEFYEVKLDVRQVDNLIRFKASGGLFIMV